EGDGGAGPQPRGEHRRRSRNVTVAVPKYLSLKSNSLRRKEPQRTRAVAGKCQAIALRNSHCVGFSDVTSADWVACVSASCAWGCGGSAGFFLLGCFCCFSVGGSLIFFY